MAFPNGGGEPTTAGLISFHHALEPGSALGSMRVSDQQFEGGELIPSVGDIADREAGHRGGAGFLHRLYGTVAAERSLYPAALAQRSAKPHKLLY